MSMFDELKALGANVDEGLERCLGRTDLYEKFINKLPEMLEDPEIKASFDNGDYKTAVEKTHAIKGVTGNLSITPLFEAYSDIVSHLRKDSPDKARDIFDAIQPLQDKITECIKRNRG